MEVFVPVSAVAAPVTKTPSEEAYTFAPLLDFLHDHFVTGGYQGGKMVYDLIQTIQSSADANKKEFLRNLPVVGGHLYDFPEGLRAVLSDDPAAKGILERHLGALSRDVTAATTTGVMFGLSRLAGSIWPFSVAAGAVIGMAVGGKSLDTLVQYTRENDKEE